MKNEIIRKLASNNKILQSENKSLQEQNDKLKLQLDDLLNEDIPYIDLLNNEEIDIDEFDIIDNTKNTRTIDENVKYKKIYKGIKKVTGVVSTLSSAIKIGKYAVLLFL